MIIRGILLIFLILQLSQRIPLQLRVGRQHFHLTAVNLRYTAVCICKKHFPLYIFHLMIRMDQDQKGCDKYYAQYKTEE